MPEPIVVFEYNAKHIIEMSGIPSDTKAVMLALVEEIKRLYRNTIPASQLPSQWNP